MPAYRDKSQGFGFVYLDIAELLRRKDELFPTETSEADSQKPVTFPEASQEVNFNKDPKPSAEKPLTEKLTNIRQIQENLDRLQQLHHKLHVMLEDLNTISSTKKKPSDPEE